MRSAQYLAGATCTLLAPTLPRAAEGASVPLGCASDPCALRTSVQELDRMHRRNKAGPPTLRSLTNIHQRQYMLQRAERGHLSRSGRLPSCARAYHFCGLLAIRSTNASHELPGILDIDIWVGDHVRDLLRPDTDRISCIHLSEMLEMSDPVDESA